MYPHGRVRDTDRRETERGTASVKCVFPPGLSQNLQEQSESMKQLEDLVRKYAAEELKPAPSHYCVEKYSVHMPGGVRPPPPSSRILKNTSWPQCP